MNDDARHEEELADLLGTESGRERLEGSELASMQALVDDLTDLRGQERDDLAAAAGSTVTAGRAEAALLAHASGTPSVAPRPRRLAPLLAAAAAAALLFLWAPWRSEEPPPRDEGANPDAVLGTEEALLHPMGRVSSFPPFRWSVSRPQDGWFVVVIEDLDIESPRLTETSWTPEADVAWPDEIEWRLEVYRGTGANDLVKSFLGWAQR